MAEDRDSWFVDSQTSMQQYYGKVKLLVMELAPEHDIILGNDWLYQRKAIMDFGNAKCKFSRVKKAITLNLKDDKLEQSACDSNTQKESLPRSHLSALQVKRFARKGARMFMVQVTKEQDNLSTPSNKKIFAR